MVKIKLQHKSPHGYLSPKNMDLGTNFVRAFNFCVAFFITTAVKDTATTTTITIFTTTANASSLPFSRVNLTNNRISTYRSGEFNKTPISTYKNAASLPG